MDRIIRLRFEAFEERLVPALTFQFDYRFDTSGFFNDPARRGVLEQAGREIGSRIDSHLQAIVPAGGNTWSAMIFNPADGQQVQVPNITVPTDAIVVFVGGSDLPGGQAGQGGMGGYSASGSGAWYSQIAQRGQAGFSIWGGSLSVDTGVNWNYSLTPSSSTVDFYTVVSHELGHLLGFGTAPTFDQFINGRAFNGPRSIVVNGGTAPMLSADLAHWMSGTTSNGQPVSLQPYVLSGQRYGLSELDFAALDDLGWTISAPAPTEPVVTPGPTNPTPILNITHEPIVLSGTNDGVAHIVRYINGTLVGDGIAIKPFADFNGVLRSITADVTGDGVTDIVYATGPGGPSRFTVVNGATGLALSSPVTVFGEFSGGLYLAAADYTGDGKADVVVSADQGGGGRVSIFRFTGTGFIRFSDFFGIEDANFRGGARVAAGDLNGDGKPDLVVGAGVGGGPRIALFNGLTVSQPKPPKLVGDFFAFPGDAASRLRNGVYVATGDVNNDGKADLIFGAGPGGGPHVYVLNTAQILAGRLTEAYAAPLVNFFAFNESDRGGVRVAVKDVNADGHLDLITGSGTSGTIAWFSNFNPAARSTYTSEFFSSSSEGVYVGAACHCELCQAFASNADHSDIAG